MLSLTLNLTLTLNFLTNSNPNADPNLSPTCGRIDVIVVIIIHEFHGDTSLKQNFRAAVNVTY